MDNMKYNNKLKDSTTSTKGWTKFRSFFGRSHSALDDVGRASHQALREQAISDKTLRSLSNESDLSTRLKALKDLEKTVTTRYLDETIIAQTWCFISDLFSYDQPADVRQEAFLFLTRLCRGQYRHLGLNRAIFFNFLKSYHNVEDVHLRIELLKQLTSDGKDTCHFEDEIASTLLSLFDDVFQFGPVSDFLNLLINFVKYSASCFDEQTIRDIIDRVCIFACTPEIPPNEVEVCLNVLDTVQSYSFVPMECLLTVITCLCKLVNSQKLCGFCWKFMRKLLNTHLGHTAVYILCNILQSADVYPDPLPVRGAVFFLGVSLWGSQRVQTLKHTPVSILPSLHDALSCNSFAVVNEVALSIQRLVVKYGIELQLVTWDIIVLIMEKLLNYIDVEKVTSDSYLYLAVHETLTTMERYHESNSYNGSGEQLFALVEYSAKDRPESSILRLLNYKAQSLSPLRPHWLQVSYKLIENYYRKDARTSIRMRAVNLLRNVYTDNKFLYGEEIIEQLILPLFSNLSTEKDFEVQEAAANFIIDVTRDCTSTNFFGLVQVLERTLNAEFETFNFAFEEDSLCYFANIRSIVCGLVDLLGYKWNQSMADQPLYVLEILVTHLAVQYAHTNVDPGYGCDIREMIFDVVLHLKTNQKRQLCYCAQGLVICSPYIYSIDLDEDLSPPMSPTTTPSTAHISGGIKLYRLDFKQTLTAVSACLQKERCWPPIRCVLANLPNLLHSRLLVLQDSQQISTLCTSVLLLLQDSEARAKAFTRTSERLSSADLNDLVYPVLSSLIPYNKFLSDLMQKKLVMAIQCGLVSHNSTLCVAATINCILELSSVILPMVRDLILRLSEISPAPKFAIPSLELLATLMRLPDMFGTFGEKDFHRLFNTILPYTDPYRFTYFIVSFAYHVAFRWYLRSPVAIRPSIAKCILSDLGKRSVPPPGSVSSDPGLDRFQDEAKSVCTEFLSRFLFSNDVPTSDKSSADFLMSGRKCRSWLLADRVVTISTCRGESGLCEKCCVFLRDALSLKKKHQRICSGNISESGAPSVSMSSAGGSTTDPRKRHKSAVQRRIITKPRLTSLDDSCLSTSNKVPELGSNNSESICDVRALHSGQTVNDNNISKKENNDTSFEEAITLPVCNCWCSGWALIEIRHAYGYQELLLQVRSSKVVSTATGDQAVAILNMINSLLPDSLHKLPCSDSEDPALVDVSPIQISKMKIAEAETDLFMNLDSEIVMCGRERAATIASMGRRPTTVLSGSSGFSRRSSLSSRCSLHHAHSDADLTSTSPDGAANRNGRLFVDTISPDGRSSRYKHSSANSQAVSPVSYWPLNSAERPRALDPCQIFLQLFGASASLGSSDFVLLPQTDTVDRTIKLLDRMPALETYKIGVVYVGPKQTSEVEILANQYGSLRYQSLIEGLGRPLCLKNVDPAKTFVGGLETNGNDGTFTYFWGDAITQVVFHVATLIPTRDSDPQCLNKKRHIGNDFVCIVYNDSDNDFELGTVRAQFAYVAIVVQPVDESALLVTVKAKDEISRWLALKQLVVSDAQAPFVCLQLAMRAEKSANIWQSQQKKDPYVSNAVERLRHIRRLREKQRKNPPAASSSSFLDYISS